MGCIATKIFLSVRYFWKNFFLFRFTFFLLIAFIILNAWQDPYRTVGHASWYGKRFHGRKTANSEIFDQWAMTAAHRHLPFNTVVKVTNLKNNLSVIVRINDRGPYWPGRIIDLSRGAAEQIGMVQGGIAKVRIERVSN